MPIVIWAAVILACGTGRNANQNTDGGSGGGGPTLHTLIVAVSGSGKITSAPAGIDCGVSCSSRFDAGTQVALTASAAPGWKLTGWSGACSGDRACAVQMDGDVMVIATFSQVPQNTDSLSVVVQGTGSGRVTSSPAGIDCPGTCGMTVASGTIVSLTVLPGADSTFSGWGGGCSGSGTCSLTVSADVTVWVNFATAVPPPDECAGLLPPSLPLPVIATLPDNECLQGTSDELGNYLLGYLNDAGIHTISEYLFFTLTDGQAVRIGSTVSGGEYVSIPFFSQPSGFTAVYPGYPGPRSSISSYSHAGVFTSRIDIAPYEGKGESWGISVDPDGGTALVRNWLSGAGWVTEYARLAKAGTLEVGWTTIDTGAHAVGVGVALSGHVLLLETKSSSLHGRWLERSGAPITDWFGPIASGGEPTFLMDGSLVLRGAGSWQYRIAGGATTPSALPGWLSLRSTDTFHVIRNGAAYALWGPDGHCGHNGLEVVAVTGKSCGCLQVPYLQGDGHDSSRASIGRDGSLIVPEPPVNFGKCTYDLYPQLLR